MNLAVHKKRLKAMLIVTGLSVTAGVAAYLGFVRNDNPIFLGAFFAAMAAGFGAQIWFILGLAKAGRGG
jgi:uncharacterized membrane protein YjjB (DUF3815 family)